ncbi:MAG: hypothetical protein AAGD86_15145, partial [Pseudomonadota bacterium]
MAPRGGIFNPFAVKHRYAATGHLDEVLSFTTGSAGEVYWEALAMDALGNVTDERLGGTNALSTLYSYDQATGALRTKVAGAGGLQNLSFDWDAAGNLETRTDHRTGNAETFGYDALFRLETVTTLPSSGGAITTAHSYDDIGNLRAKGGISNYQYGSRPHAVSSVTLPGGATRSYSYDGNGNLETMTENGATRRTVVWTSYNKPASITATGSANASHFYYAPDRARYKQVVSI